MNKQLFLLIILLLIIGVIVIAFGFFILIQPQIKHLNQAKRVLTTQSKQHTEIKSPINFPNRKIKIQTIIEQEADINHCVIRQINTNLNHAIKITILATYPEIKHIIERLDKKIFRFSCTHLSIGDEKNTGLLQLKLDCKSDD